MNRQVFGFQIKRIWCTWSHLIVPKTFRNSINAMIPEFDHISSRRKQVARKPQRLIKIQPRIKPTTKGQTSLLVVPGSIQIWAKLNPERIKWSDWMQIYTGTRGEQWCMVAQRSLCQLMVGQTSLPIVPSSEYRAKVNLERIRSDWMQKKYRHKRENNGAW
jgi:hypothetical protein